MHIFIAINCVNNDYVSYLLYLQQVHNVSIMIPFFLFPYITCFPFLLFLDTLDRDEAREAIEDILSSLSLLILSATLLEINRNGEIFLMLFQLRH